MIKKLKLMISLAFFISLLLTTSFNAVAYSSDIESGLLENLEGICNEADFTEETGGATMLLDPSKITFDINFEFSRATEGSQVEPAAGTFRIYGKWNYLNEDGGWSPGRYMLIEIWDQDDTGDDLLASGWTNSNGEFNITAPNDDGVFPFTSGADPYIRYIAMGEWDWVSKDAGGSTYSWRYPSSGTIQNNVPDGWVYNTGSRAPTSSNEALQAGDAVYAEAQWVYNRVSWMRPTKVTIVWPIGTTPNTSGDTINLPSKSTYNWNHVDVHHNYAHSIMWTLYGNSWPPGYIGGDHWVYMEDVPTDAYMEGWAEFMQCAVDNDPNNLQGGGHNIETNDWFNHQDYGTMDGAYVEGEVASIFWDIMDGISDETAWNLYKTQRTLRDQMAWGFDEIFTIIKDHYSSISNIEHFWSQWAAHYPTVSTSLGPLSNIYWAYGIDHDSYSPGGTIVINSGDLYTTSRTVTLTLNGSDWGSGVYYMRFSEDWGSTWGSWYTYSTIISFYITDPGDGLKYVDVQYADYEERLSSTGSIYDGIYLDTVSPTGSIVINSGNPQYTRYTSTTLYLTYSDATSGVDKVRYSNDAVWDTEPWESPSATKAWTLTTGDGTKTVYYQIRDKAGKLSTVYSDTIILDQTPPVTSISHAPGSSTVSISATDALSGVGTIYYRIDSGGWIVYTGPFALSGTGSHLITATSYDKAGNLETPYKTLNVHYLTVQTDPAGIVGISGSGWYNQGSVATTGTAPGTVVYSGKTYKFSTWLKDGTPIAGNPAAITIDSPHTLTAKYVLEANPSFDIWTDKASYSIGEKMYVYVRVKNPGSALPVRAIIKLQLYNGAFYGPLLDMTTTLPAGFDSGNVLWESFTLPSVPSGTYKWISELRNPSTNALIASDTWTWTIS